ncbi:unnamed protein product [Ostreobium quekettii]|uniref:Saposin B-type domain-containing protein n=1 Tax=Ostreobium quekettii TaxID=121088 RepID=A0A8S1JG02_9CHLO|nr:unnamed protein product [Ostreobium quekettii]|eukprot:evm.model.scf_610.5 EVM.evm.TU.scf_610.5   scf_610:34073-39061(-)
MNFGAGRPDEAKAPAVKADIRYIKCGVCEHLVREALRGVKRIAADVKPGKKVEESEIMDMLDNLCDPDAAGAEGEWIARTDLVEDNERLLLVDMPQVGECGTECRTVARACVDMLDDFDVDLAEALFKGEKKRAALTDEFCRQSGRPCSKKPPPLPQTRPRGPGFKALTEEEIRMKKMMREMSDMGLGGQVFDRDSAMQQLETYRSMLGDAEGHAQGDDLGGLGAFGGLDVVEEARRAVKRAATAIRRGWQWAATVASEFWEGLRGGTGGKQSVSQEEL